MSNREELWSVYAARRAAAIYDAAGRQEEFYNRHPELTELDRKIAECGSRYCMETARGANAAAAEAELQKLQKQREDLLKKFHADLEPHFTCPLCRDTGITGEGLCECFRKELIALNFRDSNLDKSAEEQSFETFDLTLYSAEPGENGLLPPRENMRRILQIARSFVTDFSAQTRSLLFTGATGLGKTYLSTCIARALLTQGRSVIYLSAPEFARRVEAERFRAESELIAQLAACDMLILDDLGTESRTTYTMATLTDLMDQRIRAGRPMLFSTNLNLDGLQQAYDERIVSRLLGNFSYFFFYGEDLRRKAFLAQ